MLNQFRQKSAAPRHGSTPDILFLLSALAGLLALAGLIYRAGTTPAQAARPSLEPARSTPAAPASAIQAQAQITAQATVTPLDVVVVFDISGSMEDQTICDDCWVRTSYNPDWPNNGYFNPLPYNPAWATAGTDNQSIPNSGLCTVYPPQPFITNTYQYLTVEAELYSRNAGNWGLDVRTPGQGFWALQRASKGSVGMSGEDSDQKNQAGSPASQSSNVCRPNVIGGPSSGIDCTVGGAGNLGDNVCSSSDSANGPIAVDCSAYIAARPMATYGQVPGNIPNLSGASYNSDCFTNAGGGGSLSGACWSSSPWYSLLGPGPSTVPWVEYDFTPVWTQTTTYIWIRAIGGGEESFTWAGSSPDQIQPDPDNNKSNNITPWRKVIYWQVNNGTINQRKDNLNNDYSNSPSESSSSNSTYYFQRGATWLVNRADNSQWRWIKLGSTATVSGTQYTLKLYQGSAGYMVDKIVFTNDPNGSTPEAGTSASNLPAALRQKADGTIATASDYPNQLGPPASFGSATREACNKCNPAYGYQVDPSECTCRKNANETGYGTGYGCTLVLTSTNQMQDQLPTGLYSGLQPIRSAQEAVKHLARHLDPHFDQLGLVGYTSDDTSPNGDNYRVQNDNTRRSKLQCLSWASQRFGTAARCYDPSQGTPITYTNVLSAVEKQWPMGGTNIASGIKEGLEELGVSGFAANSNCTAFTNDGSACDRGGAAQRILILLTDGSPNANPGNCAPGTGRPDLWDGWVGTDDDDFECAMYYAYLAAQNGVSLYTIGIGTGPDTDFMTELATGVDLRGDEPDKVMFNGLCGQYFPAARPTNLMFDTIVDHARNCVLPAPALLFTKTGAPDPVLAGGLLTYTLAVTNYGALSDTGVVITDTLNPSVSFASASNGGLHSAGLVTWDVGVILPGQTVTRTLAVTVGNFVSGSMLTNTAWVTSSTGVSYSSTAKTMVAGLEQIWALNYTVAQGENLPVHLENHFNLAGPYDIYLDNGSGSSFKVCEAVNTEPTTNSGDYNCFIDASIPPGAYDLFSTLYYQYPNRLAAAPQPVEVVATSSDVSPNVLTISGPLIGNAHTIYTFTATISPITTTLPLTYRWQATGQLPLTHTSGLSDTASFTWNLRTPLLITVTATNRGGGVSATHHLTLTTNFYLPIILKQN